MVTPAILAQAEAVLKIADHAAQQSERWALVAVCIVFGIFALGVILALKKKSDEQDKAANAWLDREVAARLELARVIAENTIALREVREALKK